MKPMTLPSVRVTSSSLTAARIAVVSRLFCQLHGTKININRILSAYQPKHKEDAPCCIPRPRRVPHSIIVLASSLLSQQEDKIFYYLWNSA